MTEGQADDPWLPYQPRLRWNAGPYEALNGFQTPPLNWAINSGFKKAFFSRVAEITWMPPTFSEAFVCVARAFTLVLLTTK
jgi:hypothetical protein